MESTIEPTTNHRRQRAYHRESDDEDSCCWHPVSCCCEYAFLFSCNILEHTSYLVSTSITTHDSSSTYIVLIFVLLSTTCYNSINCHNPTPTILTAPSTTISRLHLLVINLWFLSFHSIVRIYILLILTITPSLPITPTILTKKITTSSTPTPTPTMTTTTAGECCECDDASTFWCYCFMFFAGGSMIIIGIRLVSKPASQQASKLAAIMLVFVHWFDCRPCYFLDDPSSPIATPFSDACFFSFYCLIFLCPSFTTPQHLYDLIQRIIHHGSINAFVGSFLVAYSILGSHVFDQLTGWQPTQA